VQNEIKNSAKKTENLHSAYKKLTIKKPLRINTPKCLIYMVGPDGQKLSPTLLFLLH